MRLERSRSADEALTAVTGLIEEYGQGGSGHDPRHAPQGRPYWNSFLVADPVSAFVIDTSGLEFAVETVVSTRAISNLSAFKSIIAIEADYRKVASKITFVSCDAGTPAATSDRTKSTTTTTPGGSTDGLAAGGVAEVQLVVSGTPKVDSTFTVADLGAPDGTPGYFTMRSVRIPFDDFTGTFVFHCHVLVHEDHGMMAIVRVVGGPGAVTG